MAKPKKEEEKKSSKWFAEPPVKSKCSCASSFQDKQYGNGVRLHTRQKDGKKCTICGAKKLN